MRIKPLEKHVIDRITKWRLGKKWEKAIFFLITNPRQPSLNIELMEPKHRGIYSFRLDKKYRALYFVDGNAIEIFQITKHYKK